MASYMHLIDELVQVVPQDSAILPGYIPIGIHGNHMDMTKFASIDDPGFTAVCGELRRWIKEVVAMEKDKSIDKGISKEASRNKCESSSETCKGEGLR